MYICFKEHGILPRNFLFSGDAVPKIMEEWEIILIAAFNKQAIKDHEEFKQEMEVEQARAEAKYKKR